LRISLTERLISNGRGRRCEHYSPFKRQRDTGVPEWHCIVDDLLDLSAVEVDQDGRRALLRTAPRPSIDPICRALGITLPPVFQEVPTEKASQSED
jgi:hypothetical protein